MPLVSTLQYNDLPPLPETKDEILAMAQALNANMNTDVILGDKATRRSVLQQNLKDRRIIAFSTHGLVAGDLPKLSQPALAMAGTSDPNESPLLTLEDVMRLKLDTDWVILSACNTASSDGKGDEALSGLGRGFFYAGARALLATHWSVESDSARELMTKTFTLYGQNEKLTRAEAIRQAQLNLTQTKFSHPFYWSAYALIGDGGR
jgi:CHAT domain-containing protein